MHDIDKSGWYILIPIYNIVLLASEGDYSSNQYGPNPKKENNTNEDTLDGHLMS